MAEIEFKFEQYDGQLAKSCMKRLRKAGHVIADAAKKRVAIQDAYYRYPTKSGGVKIVPAIREGKPKFWMERSRGAMRKTIRVVEERDVEGSLGAGTGALIGRDVWVMAGNKKTWWAVQMEFGAGDWKGGPRPFLRPALHASKARVQQIIENG